MLIGKAKAALVILVCVIGSLTIHAQPKPRIDFDRLIAALPDLPWEFEIRYVVKNGGNADMLRIHYDGAVDLIRWREEDPGSLALVCHSSLSERQMKGLLELLRDKKFNDLPSDSDSLVAVALSGDTTISVRLGKLVVRKIDRHQREIAGLQEIETLFDAMITEVGADAKGKCAMESVPAKP